MEFYDQLLPALGYTERYPSDEWRVWTTTDAAPGRSFFGVTEEPGHAANGNRIAFWVESRAEVDRLAEVARLAGALELSGPKPMHYSAGYYAVFFADPSGNRLEVYVRPD